MRPAYAKDLIARRQRGERIGLLIVSLGWDAGQNLAAHAGTARIVVPPGSRVHEFDWSCAVALDCLIAGSDVALFFAAATMLQAAGAASLWGEFADGISRLVPLATKYGPPFCCPEESVPQALFKRKLRQYRRDALMLMEGAYAAPIFDAARDAEWVNLFGVGEQAAITLLADKRAEALPA